MQHLLPGLEVVKELLTADFGPPPRTPENLLNWPFLSVFL